MSESSKLKLLTPEKIQLLLDKNELIDFYEENKNLFFEKIIKDKDNTETIINVEEVPGVFFKIKKDVKYDDYNNEISYKTKSNNRIYSTDKGDRDYYSFCMQAYIDFKRDGFYYLDEKNNIIVLTPTQSANNNAKSLTQEIKFAIYFKTLSKLLNDNTLYVDYINWVEPLFKLYANSINSKNNIMKKKKK